MPTIVREIRPQPGPQTTFLETAADIAIYGGGAGSGKSFALLMEACRFIKNRLFGATIFRRLSPQITNQGGLWDTAGEFYPAIGGVPRVGDLMYQWPRGGRVRFHHLQHEATKYAWQGAQLPFLGFDELTHFSESQFFYLLSRVRSTCGVRPYVRGTTNPDAGSWVKRFLAPWVDRKHPLYPTPSGGILWMLRINGVIEWSRTRAEALARFGPDKLPKSVTFIKALIHDNPALLEKDPDYLANLEAQSDVERARLLLGDWDVVNEGLVYPGFGTIVVEPGDWPVITGPQWGGIDFGFRDPFAGLRAIEDVSGKLWIDWNRYAARETLRGHSAALPRDPDHPPRYYADPRGATEIAELRLDGHDVVPCVHKGAQPIKSGVAMVTERIKERSIAVRGDLGHLIDEAGRYRYGDKGDSETPVDKDNHLMDALRYLVVGRDRFAVERDGTPPESEERRAARQAAEEAERRAEEEAHRDIENEHWWGG